MLQYAKSHSVIQQPPNLTHFPGPLSVGLEGFHCMYLHMYVHVCTCVYVCMHIIHTFLCIHVCIFVYIECIFWFLSL